ncbi:MAG TPA: putative porin [Bacteroidia bacterium]|nr:putative porin [Bacteroidia bacterium]
MNPRRFLLGLLLPLILFSAPSNAQDSLMSATRFQLSESGVLPAETHLQWPEDSVKITDAHHFDLLTRKIPIITRSGNLGGASFNPFAETGSFKLLDDGFNGFDPYLIDPLKNHFMLRNKRYTSINYHLGSRKEQHIRVRHEQVIRPGFVAGLDYGGLGSPGDYYRQLNSVRNFDLFTLYSSRTGIYSLYASYTSNKVLNQENGGIISDSLFENAGSKVDTKTLPVNLKNAQVTYKTRDYLLQQRFRLVKTTAASDTASGKRNTGIFLNQSTWWQRRSHLFESAAASDSSYFDYFYNDSTATYDSSFFNDLNNRLSLQYHWQAGNGRFLEVSAGIANQYSEYFSGDSTAYWSTTSATAGVQSAGPVWGASADLNMGMAGENSGSYMFSATGYYHPDSAALHIGIALCSASLPHTAQEQFYHSNHFIWNRADDNEQRTDVKAFLSIPDNEFSAEVEYLRRKNYIIYHDYDFMPSLQSKPVNLMAARIHYIQQLGRFGFPLQLIVQQSDDDASIPVSPLVFKTGFFYKNRFFKKALNFCAGADVSMASKSFVQGYMPATGNFYVQDQKKTGDYPFIDLYVNMGLGTAILFIKIEHLNSGFSTRDYYAAYHYPMTGRAFKFGVVWNLVD